MRRPPLIWIGTFGVFTVCCIGLAAFASGSATAGKIRPHRQDSIVFVSPVRIGRCSAGTLIKGVIAAVKGDRVAVSFVPQAAKKTAPIVTVNGERVSRIDTVRVAPGIVQGGSALVVARPARCDSTTVLPIPVENVVAYGRSSASARVAAVENKLRERIDAEKYVAAAYLFVTGMFGLWLLIHAGRLGRLEQEIRRAQAAAAADKESSP